MVTPTISFVTIPNKATCHCCGKGLKGLTALKFYSTKIYANQFVCSSCLKIMEQCRKNVEEV